MLPEPERGVNDGFVTGSSSIKTISLIFVWERIMPHWTNKFPLWSGRELTMPFNPIERILTLSPNFSCLGATVFFGACLAFKERLSFFSEIFPRTFSLVFSKSLMEAPGPAFWNTRIVSSATFFASSRISLAFSLASRRMRSLVSCILSSFFCSFSFSCLISFL